MFVYLVSKIIGSRNQREINRLGPIVEKVNQFEPSISALTNEELAGKTNEFRSLLAQGKTLDDILPEAFAVVRETAKRFLGQRHYDVQIMGGIVLHQGKIAEMKTGEGKTLTATLPLYLNALSGDGAFLVTVNDYLARRDSEWMAPVFNHLGLTIGVIQNNMSDEERKEIYNRDIIYATNNELGFDYLRDNMKFRLEDYVQRKLSYAIVDEVDSILIDEARTPLIISGSTDESGKLYQKSDEAVRRLQKDVDYEIDEKQRSVLLTESGNDKVEAFFHVENLYDVQNINILHHIHQALRANTLFRKDVEYVVKDGEVLIVDEFTGRILAGRRYSDGLHQALEAKEGVDVERESQTLASITLQNLFRLFTKLAGMTGTAMTEAEEFYNIYKLEVVSIPSNRKVIRQDKEDIIFFSEKTKFKLIVEDIKERYAKGQPVLIGTIAIETSERLSDVLKAHHIPHEVLNAKQHAREAEIVAHAGEVGRITIATNMAGRGTDIKLTPESIERGGLYILGTERHESRRIDNQLRGRAGRQGDPGESRFYISLEDELIRIFGGTSIRDKMQYWGGMNDDDIIEDKWLSKTIENAQEKVEKNNFDSRKNLLEYDDVMNQHRKVIYAYRYSILEGAEDMHGLVRDMIAASVQSSFARFIKEEVVTQEESTLIIDFLSGMCQLDKSVFDLNVINTTRAEQFESDVTNILLEQYQLYRTSGDTERMDEGEKWVMLETVDQAWKQHMLNLDHLKEGIYLRSWGQKNPLIEYKREAYAMFEDMMQSIRWEIVHRVFRLNTQRLDAQAIEKKRKKELESLSMISASVDNAEEKVSARRDADRVGRNDDCPCGSGKKYKKCCG
jgi:preprotein translocase subunit SecA